VAVGDYRKGSTLEQLPLAERRSGKTWSIQKLPPRAGAIDSALTSISCTSSHFCIAVGSYTNSAHGVFTLAERWDGTKWSIQATPNPTNEFGNALAGVSCASSSACTAVGSASQNTVGGGGSAQTHPLAERWNGKRWALMKIQGPASGLAGVSCPSTTACTAVGSYENSGGNNVTMAERWDGMSWALQTTQNPGGAIDDQLNAVSCPLSNRCTAIGEYLQSGSGVVPLAERWNGTGWAAQSVPAPTGAVGNDMFGVSCPSSKACTAVGMSFTKSGGSRTEADFWNGTTWSIQKSSNPTGFAESSLSAVSCTSSTACTAVGDKQKSAADSAGELPLVERHS
jgi:hypothetical protein